MLGTIVNAVVIVIGASLGILLRKGIPQRIQDTVMQGIALAVALVGLKMAFKTNNELIIILSMAFGGLIGEALNLEGRLEGLGTRLNSLVGRKEGDLVKGFVTGSLIYCVGAMSIMGALESGLTGQHKILFAKSAIDGITAVIFASSMGWGVAFSAISVLIYQGIITMMAEALRGLMTEQVLAEMTAVGGLLILAISSNILGIKQIKVANLLPGVIVAVFLAGLTAKLSF